MQLRSVVCLRTIASRLSFVAITASLFFVFASLAPSVAFAQDDAGAAAEFQDAAPAAEAPVAAAAAQEAGDGDAGESPVKQKNMLVWLIEVSGLIGLFILCLSFYFVAVVVQELLALRVDVVAPPEIVAECEKLVEERDLKQLFEVVQKDNSFYSRCLVAGFSELKNGLDDAREKLDRTADVMTAEMERRVSFLAVLGTLGPMIGLLGTLKGMIASFSVIAISGINLDAAKVAEGISEALVLTFEGVMLSVPAIYFYALFRNRISKLTLETTMLADDLLRSVVRVLKPAGK